MINQIVSDPADPDVVYAAARPEGVIKSFDGGKTWVPKRKGITNLSGYHLVVDPRNGNILYLGTFGGGIFKSIDGGESWRDKNDGLGNTNIHALTIDPNRTDRLIVATSTGEIFETRNGAESWDPLSQGLPRVEGEVIASLIFSAEKNPRLFLALEGLYVLGEDRIWRPAGAELPAARITSIAFNPGDGSFIAGTKEKGLWTADSRITGWRPLALPLNHAWIQEILLAPERSGRILVSTIGSGLFEGGESREGWKALEGKGVPGKDDVLSLSADRKRPGRIIAGTHNEGIYWSPDGGSQWFAGQVQQESIDQILQSLLEMSPSETPSAPFAPAETPPPSFEKCSRCHGWTDRRLSARRSYWRVAPNRRDWRATVVRMGGGAGLTPSEEEEIIGFLNRYTSRKPP